MEDVMVNGIRRYVEVSDNWDDEFLYRGIYASVWDPLTSRLTVRYFDSLWNYGKNFYLLY